ncbi:14411_t:CDS:1, partial [Dentiscutata erythropus]
SAIRSALIANGMDKVVIWDVDPQDSIDGVTESQSEETFDQEICDLNPHIVISHDRIETESTNNGYQFDTVAGCVGDGDSSNWYNVDTESFGTRDETWTCTSDDMHNSFDTSPNRVVAINIKPFKILLYKPN